MTGYIIAALVAIIGGLGLTIGIQSSKKTKEELARQKAKAKRGKVNSKALSKNAKKIIEILKEGKKRDEEIKKGNANSVLGDIVNHNNELSDD